MSSKLLRNRKGSFKTGKKVLSFFAGFCYTIESCMPLRGTLHNRNDKEEDV